MSKVVKAIECSMCGKVSPAREPLQGRCTECGKPHEDWEELNAELSKDGDKKLSAKVKEQAQQVRDLKKAVREAEAHAAGEHEESQNVEAQKVEPQKGEDAVAAGRMTKEEVEVTPSEGATRKEEVQKRREEKAPVKPTSTERTPEETGVHRERTKEPTTPKGQSQSKK